MQQFWRGVRDERAQDYIEFVLVFGLAVFLAGAFGTLAWFWWNQTVSATAIHDGTRAAAVWDGGSLSRGYATTQGLLNAGLGGLAPGPESYAIEYAGPLRSVVGSVDYQYALPFGLGQARVRARSVLRHERFYPGPPEVWE
ncbi:MAG: hypothetical protein KKA73_03645 [Chloroflexi bacterium]|nr:hypothetical protein [Chloroflexota bacterium]